MKYLNDLDYIDDKGNLHIMCACGHTVSGSVKEGDKILLCPNCRYLSSVVLEYPERIPDDLKERYLK